MWVFNGKITPVCQKDLTFASVKMQKRRKKKEKKE
jgi:hypothetical protein